MRKTKLLISLISIIAILTMTSCNNDKKIKLDPKNPIILNLMTYYNDKQLEEFEEKVTEFNETVGLEKGIIVEVNSMGSITRLNEALLRSADDMAGSHEFPDMFMTYVSIVPYLKDKVELVDYSEYFTEEELSQYNEELVNIGRVGEDKKLIMLPVGSSTALIYVNKTEFYLLKYTTGITYYDLSTYEGIAEAAEKYYKYTDSLTDTPYDGKSFYGADSLSHHVFAMCHAMGKDLLVEKNGEIIVSFDHEIARKFWEIYYVPMIKGYIAKHGKNVSEDIKTGKSLVILASTSSAPYMPENIMEEDGFIRDISIGVLKSPCLRDYEKVSINQSGGIFISRTVPTREYASAEFIKWFTNRQNNMDFAIRASYTPIRKDNTDSQYIRREVRKKYIRSLVSEAIIASLEQRRTTKTYISPSIDVYEDVRNVIEDKFGFEVEQKRIAFVKELESGRDYEELISEYLSDKEFEEWRTGIIKEVEREVKVKRDIHK